MEKVHQAAIRNCRVELVKDLLLDDLLDYLEKWGVLTAQMAADIHAEKTSHKQARKLLTDLPRRGPAAFERFLLGLVETKQVHLRNFLLFEVDRLRNLPEGASMLAADLNPAQRQHAFGYGGGCTAPEPPHPGVTAGGLPVEQALTTAQQEVTGQASIPVQSDLSSASETPVDMDSDPNINTALANQRGVQQETTAYSRASHDERYTMESTPRGFVYIINNITFKNPKWNREGAEADGHTMVQLFVGLGFWVEYETDLTAKTMLQKVKDFSQLPCHADVDSCVLAILSHGDSDGAVYGVDENKVNFKQIYSFFSSDKCPNLCGKPKLMILQACRGERGVPTEGGPSSDIMPMDDPGSTPSGSGTTDISSSLPPNSDIILAYCTQEGDVAFRNTKHGSWYIQAFTKIFSLHHRLMHVVDMLVKVNHEVATWEAGTSTSNQLPAPVIMTRKQWFLNAVMDLDKFESDWQTTSRSEAIQAAIDEDQDGDYLKVTPSVPDYVISLSEDNDGLESRLRSEEHETTSDVLTEVRRIRQTQETLLVNQERLMTNQTMILGALGIPGIPVPGPLPPLATEPLFRPTPEPVPRAPEPVLTEPSLPPAADPVLTRASEPSLPPAE